MSGYLAEIDTLDGGAILPLADWQVYESRQGWMGFGTVDPSPGETVSATEALDRVLDHGVHPEAPVAVGLWIRGTAAPDSGTVEGGGAGGGGSAAAASGLVSVRTWPAMVTEVGAPAGAFPIRRGAMVLFCDPIRYLLRAPVWGAWKDATPGELLGAALSLAVGGAGRPTLTPTLPGLPQLKIAETLSEPAPDLPYTIATGEPVGHLLARVFGRLGIRMELLGHQDGHIDVHLRDMVPEGTPVSLTLLPGRASASNAVLSGTSQRRHPGVRGVLFDGIALGESLRLGEQTDAVGDLLYGEGLERDEAEHLAGFEDDRADLDMNAVRLTTGQPGLYPGRLVTFSNRSISGASTWQVARVWHGAGEARYRNTVDVVKSGVGWRPRQPPAHPPVTVTGIVDDGRSEPGAFVARDELGRIPVTLGFLAGTPVGNVEVSTDGGELPVSTSFGSIDPGGGGGEPGADDPVEPAPAPVQLALPVIEPMAGGKHGFVVNHRQGDVCRVSVHHPMWAEVTGFSYAFDHVVGKNLVDASAALVVRNQGREWSGLLFQPGDQAEEDDVDTVAEWRQGEDADP